MTKTPSAITDQGVGAIKKLATHCIQRQRDVRMYGSYCNHWEYWIVGWVMQLESLKSIAKVWKTCKACAGEICHAGMVAVAKIATPDCPEYIAHYEGRSWRIDSGGIPPPNLSKPWIRPINKWNIFSKHVQCNILPVKKILYTCAVPPQINARNTSEYCKTWKKRHFVLHLFIFMKRFLPLRSLL